MIKKEYTLSTVYDVFCHFYRGFRIEDTIKEFIDD